MVPPTARLYLNDAYCFDHDATIVHVDDRGVVLDRSAMFPGEGGA